MNTTTTGYAPITADIRHAIDHIAVARNVAGISARGESRDPYPYPHRPYSDADTLLLLEYHLGHALARIAEWIASNREVTA